ncbi:MAG: low-complexity tail membrane protein [Cyanobacteria bacterium J06638_7]
MTSRSEPLLWLQLIALGAIPLEVLLLVLLLAGADPGPLPALERLLVWGLGALGPALLLWRRPADCCSLLLVQVPLAARSPMQRRLAEAQEVLPLKLLMAGGAAALLPLFWTLDSHAALAGTLSPLEPGHRLASLLLAVPLLALLLWQWQQLLQSVWLLSRSAADLAAVPALSAAHLAGERLSLGLPVLLLDPLDLQAGPADQAAAEGLSAGGDPVAVEPEQGTAGDQSGDLDQQID